MDCVLCGAGARSPGTTTMTLTRGEVVVVVHHVPAEVCDTCGEPVVTTETALALERVLDDAVSSGVHYLVREYQAAA